MLEYQYIRSLLVLTDLLSFICSFIIASHYRRAGGAVFYAIASFLMLSWVQSMYMILYTKERIGNTRKEGYFRVPLAGNEEFIVDEVPGSWKVGNKMGTMMFLVDLLLGLGLLITFPIGFASSPAQLVGVACMGAIISLIIHSFFCVFYVTHDSMGNGFWKYRLKLVVVRRDQNTKVVTAADIKEQRTVEEAPMHEPELIRPRSYRGSPSNKPSRVAASQGKDAARLIDPTEEDALIADRD